MMITRETASNPGTPGSPGLLAASLHHLLEAFAHMHLRGGDPIERRLDEVRALIEHHVSDALWRQRLLGACAAAERGEREALLLRFASAQCSDGGRAIESRDPSWPSTLTGDAADLYHVWQELNPARFGLEPRILDYPQGLRGDAGLFLRWGGAH